MKNAEKRLFALMYPSGLEASACIPDS